MGVIFVLGVDVRTFWYTLYMSVEELIQHHASECVEFLRELIQTPSVNGEHNEEALARVIQLRTERMGLPSRLIEIERGRPNVYIGEDGQFKSDSSILFVAHSDTVPAGDQAKWIHPPFGAEIHDGRVYGRGALDCKSGIALGIYALKILKELGKGWSGKMLIGADEESGADSNIGIRYVLERGLRACGAVYAYGGRASNELTIGHRGVLRIWVACEGELAHSGSREWQDEVRGASAIEGIMRFLEEVSRYGKTLATTEQEYFKGYRCVITSTLIEGGSGESLVPDRARVLLDIRTLPNQKNEDIISGLRAIGDKLSEGKVRYSFAVKNNVPAAISDPTDTFIASVQETMQEVFGYKEVSLKGSGPANESYMLIAKGIPTVVGFGSTGSGFHSADEYAEVSSIEQSLRFLVTLALKN